ncbi:MAG: DUF2283 domain-containing protein [Pseudonocardia sp.]
MIKVEVDTVIGAAYIQLSDTAVSRTEEYSEDINVDLDAHGMVVGIELLDTSMSVPLDELVVRYHIKSSTMTHLLASLQSASSAVMSSAAQLPGSTRTYRAIGPREVMGL